MKFAIRIACMLAGLTVVGLDSTPARAGAGLVADPGPASQAPTNSAPNRYRRIKDFFKLPPGRTMGSSSAVAIDHEGHLWVADRCGRVLPQFAGRILPLDQTVALRCARACVYQTRVHSVTRSLRPRLLSMG